MTMKKSSNHKGGEQEKKATKKLQNNQKTITKNFHIYQFTLNVNALRSSIKRQNG